MIVERQPIFDAADKNPWMTRGIVYGVIVLCIVYDCIAFACGWLTITQASRELDRQTGSLLRWAILAVWVHIYYPNLLKSWSY